MNVDTLKMEFSLVGEYLKGSEVRREVHTADLYVGVIYVCRATCGNCEVHEVTKRESIRDCVSLLFITVTKTPDKEQLRRGKIYFGSQF